MPNCDSVCPFSRACAWVTWPTRRVPFFSTTLPSCFTSSCVRACTSSPGLLCLASRELASAASILVPSGIFAPAFPELAFPALAFAELELEDLAFADFAFAEADEEFDADPLPETCAPEAEEEADEFV